MADKEQFMIRIGGKEDEDKLLAGLENGFVVE